MKVKVYVEGGGDGRDLRTRCRRGFSAFFERASLAGRMPRIVACGSRETAFDRFRTAFGARKAGEFVVLLVDSEAPVADDAGSWEHLARRDGWNKPGEATDEHAHLMVECMEAWFLADTASLAAYFGRDFDRRALRRHGKIEDVAKDDVQSRLRNATRRCAKGQYGKGRHSFAVLERTDPAKVLAASPHAERLIDTLREKAT